MGTELMVAWLSMSLRVVMVRPFELSSSSPKVMDEGSVCACVCCIPAQRNADMMVMYRIAFIVVCGGMWVGEYRYILVCKCIKYLCKYIIKIYKKRVGRDFLMVLSLIFRGNMLPLEKHLLIF